MAAAATAEAPAKVDEMVNFCKYLAGKGAVALEKLPERFYPVTGKAADGELPPRDCALIAKALVLDFIEIGQRQYAINSPEVRVHVDKAGVQSVIKNEVAQVSDEWTWTNLKGPKRKQLPELLEEQSALPEEVRLHVKLTSEGMAQTV